MGWIRFFGDELHARFAEAVMRTEPISVAACAIRRESKCFFYRLHVARIVRGDVAKDGDQLARYFNVLFPKQLVNAAKLPHVLVG
jgi:hypothetical protein